MNKIRVSMYERGYSIPDMARVMRQDGCVTSTDRLKRLLRGEVKDAQESEFQSLAQRLEMEIADVRAEIAEEARSTLEVRATRWRAA